MATTTPKTEQEAAAMRQALAEFDRQAAEKANAERAELIAPVKGFVDSKAFAEVEAKARELAPAFATIEAIDVHLRPLSGFLARLREAVDGFAPIAPLPAPGPVVTTPTE
jgi:hypothetical protein